MRHSPRNLRIACDHRGLTHFGGVCFFHEFLQVLQLRHFLAQNLTYPRRNRRYSLSQMVLALVYPIVLGLDRIETASFLRSNGTFQYLTGLPCFPDPQTLRRFLLQAPDSFREQMHRVNDRLLQNFIHLPDHRSRLILDLRRMRPSVTIPVIVASAPITPCSASRPTLLTYGIPNSARATPAPGRAAWNCWRPASSTYRRVPGEKTGLPHPSPTRAELSSCPDALCSSAHPGAVPARRPAGICPYGTQVKL